MVRGAWPVGSGMSGRSWKQPKNNAGFRGLYLYIILLLFSMKQSRERLCVEGGE